MIIMILIIIVGREGGTRGSGRDEQVSEGKKGVCFHKGEGEKGGKVAASLRLTHLPPPSPSVEKLSLCIYDRK